MDRLKIKDFKFSEGASGAITCVTEPPVVEGREGRVGHRYFVKGLTEGEVRSFETFVDRYQEYIMAYPGSLLGTICMVVEIKSNGQVLWFAVFLNLEPRSIDRTVKYDMKVG